MKDETKEMLKEGASDALKGGAVASAIGVLTGAVTTVVTTTTPTTILWGLITTGATIASAPVIVPAALATVAIGGAVAGGAYGVNRVRRKHRWIDKTIREAEEEMKKASADTQQQPQQ